MEKIKRVVVDFKLLRNPYCGIGQVAVNTFNRLKNHKEKGLELKFYSYMKYVMDKSKCIEIKWWHKLFYNPKNVDVWHTSHQLGWMPNSKKIKKILTIYDINFYHEMKDEAKKNKLIRKFIKNVKKADYLVFSSEFGQKNASTLIDFSDKKQEVLYLGVNFETKKEIDETKKPKYDLPEKFMFCISELKEKKNFHKLIEMLPFLDKEIHLVLAGNQSFVEYRERLKKLATEFNVSDRVHWLGKITEDEKVFCYQKSEALVFPSICEGFGIPPIEAMRLGKPAFLSTKTSLPEIGGEYAFYWENFEPKYMAEVFKEKINFYNNNPDYSQKLIDFSNRYNWEDNVKRYLEIYKNI